MTRSTRYVLAWIGILGIACAQVAVSAHACTLGGTARSTSTPQLHQGHCAGVVTAEPVLHPQQANACEVRCTDGAHSSSAPDLPPGVSALPAVAVRPVAIAIDGCEWGRSVLLVKSAAPPLFLQYCHFLN